VESFVFFTMFFLMYSEISFAANFTEGLSKGFQLSDSTSDAD
jgi:hypothetical protein